MKPRQKDHANQLEELLSSRSGQNSSAQLHSVVPDDADTQVSEMVALARHLQTSPPLVADPVFAQRLERRVLAHSIRHRQTKAAGGNRNWLFGRVPRTWIALAAILLCMFIGTGSTLAMAAGVSNPDNPLYGIKVWEQHVQVSLASSPQNRADVSLQIIRDRLNTASSLTDASHTSDYHQAIEDIEQQLDTVSQSINALPAGSDRQRLSSELATLTTDTRHTLSGLLVRLPFTEQLATTTLLSRLGASVPSIQQATVAVIGPPSEQARITITGTNLTSSTRLVINNQPVAGNCTLQNNTCVFVISWHDQSPPNTIAVLNEDDTAAQTTVITFASPNGGNGNNGNGSNSGDGNNKNGGNSGDGTNPTGKGTNGNGNNGDGHNDPDNGAKPTSTPGAKPTNTPPPDR